MSRRLGLAVRLLGGAAILGGLVWKVGAGPFLDGLRAVNVWSLVLAVLLCALTTVCAAWRWVIVARGLGITLRLPQAIAASYRAQFLNTALPGGVLGDVHRGVRHGQDTGDVQRALRAVVWERTAGQFVQVLIAIVVLSAVPSPFRHTMPVVVATAIGIGLVLVLAVHIIARTNTGRIARLLRIAAADVRYGVLARDAWPRVVAASIVVVAGHTATFLVAVHAAGTSAATDRLLPIALLVLLATSVPTNIGGWGPREGVAAWAFAAAGFGAAQGLAVATTYGVLVMIATMPGMLVLIINRRRPARTGPTPQREPSPAPAVVGGPARG
jgi:uncharacterized membrane protein YbhN (UPF0104 family)